MNRKSPSSGSPSFLRLTNSYPRLSRDSRFLTFLTRHPLRSYLSKSLRGASLNPPHTNPMGLRLKALPKSPLVLQDSTVVAFDTLFWPTRPGHSLLLPRSSVIRSQTAPSVNTHYVRTQCDLGIEQSKFATELMAGEWEWGVSTGFSFSSLNSSGLSPLAHAWLMICDLSGIIACFQRMVDFDTGCVPIA